MDNHKLIRLLKTFSKEEFKHFEKFAASSFHNESRNYTPFLKELKKYYPKFSSKNFTKETVFGEIYGSRKYSETMVNTTLSRTLKIAENYLGYLSYIKKNIAAKYDYINELMNRGLFDIAEKELREYSKMLINSDGITDEWFKSKMDYEILKVQFSLRNDRNQDASESSLNQVDYHIRFTITRLAHFIHNLNVNNVMFNIEFNKTFINKFITSVNLNELYNALKEDTTSNEINDITLIYLLWIVCLTSPKQIEYFYEMKKLFLENIDKFHSHEKYNLFQGLEAIAWFMMREVDREKFEPELVDLYKKRVEMSVLSPDNTHMRIILYRAILITSFHSPDWNFIESFVKKGIGMLQEKHRENMYNFSMAHVHYYKGNFDDALKFNNKINFEMFAFKYDTRLLQFKIYYELGYFNEAYSLIDSHRHFISNNKTVSEHYKLMHTNFLNFYAKIITIKEKEKLPGTLPKLINEITDTNNVLSKAWLIDKAKELKIIIN